MLTPAGFAPASIVSPLGVVALISNCVFAPVLLKEPFRSRDALGVLVSVAGAVVVVWSAEKEEIRLGPDEILGAISQTAFEVYFGITSAMILTLMYISTRYGHKTIMIDLGLVALLGGYTVLSTKGISSLISSSFYHIFQYPIAYLFTFVLATTAILQIKYINRALKRFDSTQVIPTQFVLFTISVIVGSAVLYRDFEAVGKDRMLKFVTGCALTFAGVYLISSKRNNTNKPVPDEEQALSETTDLLPPTPTPEAEASTTISVRPPLNRRISAISASPTPSPTGRKSDSLHRALNLMPGSGLISGYQLQSVIVERVSESLTRAMSSEFVGEEEEEEGEEPHLHHQLHRRRSSLGVVLDYMKGKRREEGEGEGVGRG